MFQEFSVARRFLASVTPGLVARTFMWDGPTMTVTTDGKKRVVIPSAKPGDRFDVEVTSEGKVVLTRLELTDKPDNVRLVKKHGYTVARGTRTIRPEQVRKALDEFP
jgi:hypothetical protein